MSGQYYHENKYNLENRQVSYHPSSLGFEKPTSQCRGSRHDSFHMEPEQLTEEIVWYGEWGPDPRSPLHNAYRSAAIVSAPPRLTTGWGRGDTCETKLFLLTCLFITFVPCCPASLPTLRIPGVVTPPRLAKRKQVEVPLYLFITFLLVLKPFKKAHFRYVWLIPHFFT